MNFECLPDERISVSLLAAADYAKTAGDDGVACFA